MANQQSLVSGQLCNVFILRWFGRDMSRTQTATYPHGAVSSNNFEINFELPLFLVIRISTNRNSLKIFQTKRLHLFDDAKVHINIKSYKIILNYVHMTMNSKTNFKFEKPTKKKQFLLVHCNHIKFSDTSYIIQLILLTCQLIK